MHKVVWLVLVCVTLGACGGTYTTDTVLKNKLYTDPCPPDARLVALAPGVGATGNSGTFDFVVTDATPVPVVAGPSTLRLQLLDRDNAPVSGATLTVSARRPGDSSSASVQPSVQLSGSSYVVDSLDLPESGVWEVALAARTAAASDAAQVLVCVPDADSAKR